MPANNTLRVVIDTNLWISFLISKSLIHLDQLIIQNKIKLIYSTELFEEFVAVANRPKLKKYFKPSDIQSIIQLFDVFGELIHVTSNLKLCRDEKDNFLLSLSKDGNADYLITGDLDLLVLNTVEKTQITTYAEFISKIEL